MPSKGLRQGGEAGWSKMIGPDVAKSQQFLPKLLGWEHLSDIKNISVLDDE